MMSKVNSLIKALKEKAKFEYAFFKKHKKTCQKQFDPTHSNLERVYSELGINPSRLHEFLKERGYFFAEFPSQVKGNSYLLGEICKQNKISARDFDYNLFIIDTDSGIKINDSNDSCEPEDSYKYYHNCNGNAIIDKSELFRKINERGWKFLEKNRRRHPLEFKDMQAAMGAFSYWASKSDLNNNFKPGTTIDEKFWDIMETKYFIEKYFASSFDKERFFDLCTPELIEYASTAKHPAELGLKAAEEKNEQKGRFNKILSTYLHPIAEQKPYSLIVFSELAYTKNQNELQKAISSLFFKLLEGGGFGKPRIFRSSYEEMEGPSLTLLRKLSKLDYSEY